MNERMNERMGELSLCHKQNYTHSWNILSTTRMHLQSALHFWKYLGYNMAEWFRA